MSWREWEKGMDPGEADYPFVPDSPRPTPIKEPDFSED
jgi:hypothetical protein